MILFEGDDWICIQSLQGTVASGYVVGPQGTINWSNTGGSLNFEKPVPLYIEKRVLLNLKR